MKQAQIEDDLARAAATAPSPLYPPVSKRRKADAKMCHTLKTDLEPFMKDALCFGTIPVFKQLLDALRLLVATITTMSVRPSVIALRVPSSTFV